MPVVDLQAVTKTYQMGDSELSALKGVSFSIDKGEFVAIMGASGSGKSTTMNMIGLLDKPTSGTYKLLGENVASLSMDQLADYRNQYIGFVFQSFLLLPKLTVLQNVGMPLLYRKLPADDIKLRATRLLEQVGMGEYLQHKPYELSGGQQQRVAIARALVGEPQLILADEPTGALDTVTGQCVLDLLREIHQQRKVTVVIITHDKSVAEHCQRVITLSDGLVVTDDWVAARSNTVEG
jgi:putative ABC transport system ATP-binding protein